jgi:glucokinase
VLSSEVSATRLVADIGGTNSRLALYDPVSEELRSLRTYINREYVRFEDIVLAWLSALTEGRPVDCCLAVAAPPFGDRVTMLNIDWSFSLAELAKNCGFVRLRGINDFEGNAYALPHLGARDLSVLHAGRITEGSKLAVVGPGTGLGGATLSWVEGSPIANASEPGHMGLSPGSELELALFHYLLPRHSDVYAELLVSGPGLQQLYQALGAIRGQAASPLSPAEISTKALGQECELCTEALNTFCALLGSICGDFVLANGAYGGLYLAGGILPGMLDFLQQSTFVQRFQEKGKMRAHLANVPLYLITSETTGLTGAAHAPLQIV